MKTVKKTPSVHIPIQKPDGSMEWVWYMFFQWLSENLESSDLSNYYTKSETNAILQGYAIDSNVVHKSGAETITGNKNFTGTNDFYRVNFSTAPTTAVPSSWGAVIKAKASFITSNYDVPGEGQYWQTQGVDVTANDNSYLSWSATSRYSDGSTNYSICVRARADAESPNKDASMGIRVWPDGTSLTFAPNPVYSSNTTAIATTYWVRNLITTSTDLVHRTGDETINGIKTFNAEIKGRFRTASCHTGADNTNCWYKLGEFKSRSTYNTHLVMFRAWVGTNGTQQDGLVCGRIVTRTGSTGAGSEGKLTEGRIVFDTKPAWLDFNNFVILYKNDQTDDTGDYVQIEFWARTYSAYNGYTFSIFDERTGGEVYNPLWTFYNLPSGVADLPTGYTGQTVSRAPNDTNTNVVHTSGDETIAGYKTFTNPTTMRYLTLGPEATSQTSIEGGEISFVGGAGEPNAGKAVKIDRYNGTVRIFGVDSQDNVKVVFYANIEQGTLSGVTPIEDTTFSIQLDTVGARNTKLQSYQPLLTAGSNITINNNTISATDTTYSVMTGATSSTAGTSGLVPAPASGDNDKFLKGDGTWDAVSAGGYHPNLFDTKWSDHLVNDVQWLRGDTFSWQSGSVYEAAYDHLVDDINGKSLTSETVGSTTVQFYLADDGHKVCPAAQESNVAAIYAATGVAWYYILDTTNTRFKLPRTKFAFTGLRDIVGKAVEPGLPNITGVVSGTNSFSAEGAFVVDELRYISAWDSNVGFNPSKNSFDASRCSSVYGNSTTVQVPATQMYLYFYVGQFTQTALENTAGLNASLFNGKADLNLLNTASNVDFVIESQEPNIGNDYTWYRKYKSGWVEQGGTITGNYSGTITFSVVMADTNYYVSTNVITNRAAASHDRELYPTSLSTTGFTLYNFSGGQNMPGRWQVSGMAA